MANPGDQLSMSFDGGSRRARRQSKKTGASPADQRSYTADYVPPGINPEDYKQYGSQEKMQLINEPTTIGVPVSNDGKVGQFDIGPYTPNDRAIKLANNFQQKNWQGSSSQPYAINNTNPGTEVTNNIDDAEIKARIDGVADIGRFNQDRSSASQVNNTSVNSGTGLSYIQQLVQQAKENPNVLSQMTKNDLNNAYSDVMDSIAYGDPDAENKMRVLASAMNRPAKYAEPAIERLGLTEYYPDMGQPIRVGGYSGSIIGSNDIYVAQGGLFPASIVDARARALQDAAKERAKQKEKIMDMVNVKAAYPYQEQFDNLKWDVLNKYGDSVNWDWDKLNPYGSKQGMKFWQDVNRLQTLGKVNVETHSKMEDLLKKMSGDEKVFVSPEQQKMLEQWYLGNWDMKKVMDDEDTYKEYMRLSRKAKEYDNMDFHARDAAKQLSQSMDNLPIKLKGDIDYNNPEIAKSLADIYTYKQHRDYDRYTSALLKFVQDDRVDQAAQSLIDNRNFYLSGDKEKDLDSAKKKILAYLGHDLKIDEKMQHTNALGWAKLNFDKQQAQTKTIYTTLANNMTNPQTTDYIKRVVTTPNATPEQKANAINGYMEKITGGGRVDPASGKLEYHLPLDPKKSNVSIKQVGDLYTPDQLKKVLSQVQLPSDMPDDQRTRLTNQIQSGDWRSINVEARPVREKVSLGNIKDGKYIVADVHNLSSNPNQELTPVASTVYSVSVPYIDQYGKQKYVDLPINGEDNYKLDQFTGIAAKDADYGQEQPFLKKMEGQGLDEYSRPENPQNTVPDFN